MLEKISIVIIDRNENSRLLIKTQLREINGVEAEASEPQNGYQLIKQIKPTIVILDLSDAVDDALELAEKITNNFPEINLFVTASDNSPEVIIKAMRAGAREFLRHPIDSANLDRAIKKVIRSRLQKDAERKSLGKVITIFGVKGGIGTTTISTNLAVNFAECTDKSVALVDLDLQFGDVALHLNLEPKYSISELMNNIDGLDQGLLRSFLTKHTSGLHLLSSPHQIEDAEAISDMQIGYIINLLRSMFDYIVVNTSHNFDTRTIEALDRADLLLMVLTPDLLAIHNTKKCLDVFQKLGYRSEKIHLLINRYTLSRGVLIDEFEQMIKYPIFWRLPEQNYDTIVDSINKGVPISTMAPKAKISLSFKDLAYSLNGSSHTAANRKTNGKGIFKKLTSKLSPREKR